MDIIKLARELGAAIQQDADYAELIAARDANDNDGDLQKLIGDFNLYSISLEEENSKDQHDEEKINKLQNLLQETYDQAMANPNMVRFENAKNKMDEKMNHIVAILAAAVNGEDPMTFEPHNHEGGCHGDCSCCHGC